MALLIDSDTGRPWSPGNRRACHRRMREQVIADLRARDERRGADVPTYRLGVGNKYIPDEEVMHLKHTAAETNALFRYRWAQFVAKPRSEKEFLASTKKAEGAIDSDLEEAGRAIERSLKETGEQAPKRKRKATSKT